MDVPDIKFIVQYKATCDLCTLWQCFGRAARAVDLEATVILLFEDKDILEDGNKEGIRTAGNKRTAEEILTVEVLPAKHF